MKKILSFIAILLVGLVLVACEPTVKEDGAQAKLDTAHAGMDILISDPSNITANFVVPSMLAGGIEAVWTSDNPGVISFGAAVNNEVTATVNRPAKGQGDATVKITATLKLKSELSDEILEKKWEKTLTVKENTVEEIEINTIADILAIRDETYDGGEYTVTIPNVTIFAKGDVFFGYDGTGIIQLFNSQTTFEVGKVYDVTGALEWYFGIWELVKSTGVEKASATPQYPTKEIVNSVDSKISELTTAGEHNYPVVADGNFEPIYATVKGNIFMIEGDSSNYNTYIIDAAKDALVLGEQGTPASGFMFYYGTSDLPYVRSFAGFEVEMDVVIYTYRSNNLAFAVYYVGGEEGITANLNEEQKVDVAKNALKLPVEVYKADQTLTLANKSDEVNIAWSFKDSEDANNAFINLADGKVTLPTSGQKDVKLVATLTLGDVSTTKEFTIRVGEVAPSTIAEVLAATNNTYKFMITGTVLGYNGHGQISVADETGAITVYPSEDAANLALLVGKQVRIIGSRTVYRGLIQLGSPEVTNLELDGTMPVATDLRTIDLWDAESLLPFQSNLVSVSNLKVKEVIANEYGNVELILEDEVTLKTIRFYWDSRQPLVGSSDFIKGLKVGDYVSFTNALLTWRSNNGAIGIHAAAQVAVGESPVLTDEEELALDKQLLELPANVTESLVLPVTLTNGTTVVWTSSVPATIANDGTFVQPASDTPVTLTAALTNGEETDTKVFEVVAKGPIAASTLKYTIDFGTFNTNGTGYGAGDLTFENGDAKSYTFNKDRVQINNSTFEPHVTAGNFLVMSIRDNAHTAFIEFDFTAETGLSKLSMDVSVWNQNNIDPVKNVANGHFALQIKVGDNWVDVENDTEVTNLLPLITVNVYTTITFNLEGPGLYRLVYSGEATASSNTVTALTVDNIKVYTAE